MTKKIGNKHVAQHRGIKERQEIRRTNIAREAIKRAIAASKYRNEIKGQRQQTEVAVAA
jgi:hypothetical protein